jgi:hypothetical protein
MSKSCAACFCAYEGYGNNGAPLFETTHGCVLENVPNKQTNNTRVCDECNTQFVIPYRMIDWFCRKDDPNGRREYMKMLGNKINEARFTTLGKILKKLED